MEPQLILALNTERSPKSFIPIIARFVFLNV